ncbi:MAG: transaldolase [Campylobacterales bacterium]|nr:transaldolase [Campylobacterales bacterium]
MSLRNDYNYSIWCDFIERDFLENQFQEIINDGIIHGATSNPAIFQQSISNSHAYEQQIQMLQANDTKKIYEELAITDIKRAAQILKPLHDRDANDGFISLEVDPTLCDDMMGTIEEGARLYAQIGYDNLMIKIPATEAGYGAMRELTGMGINVNATLIFSKDQAIKCAQALNTGIKQSGKDTKGVISVFVSRFDRLMDTQLESVGLEKGKLGVINAIKCYHEIEKFQNANIRTLFASTGVKGNDLAPSYYIDELIYKNTINTAPLATIEQWKENGKKELSKQISEKECDLYFAELEKNGFNLETICNQLLQEGLSAFKVSFKELMEQIKKD